MNKKCPKCSSNLKHVQSISRNVCYECGFSEETAPTERVFSKNSNITQQRNDQKIIFWIGIISIIFVFVATPIVILLEKNVKIAAQQKKIKETQEYQQHLARKKAEEARIRQEHFLAELRREDIERQSRLQAELMLRSRQNYIDTMRLANESVANILSNTMRFNSSPSESRLSYGDYPLRRAIRRWPGDDACLCPYDQFSRDEWATSLAYSHKNFMCGEMSSYVRSGGQTPACYSGDHASYEARMIEMQCRADAPNCYVVN